MQRAQAVAAGKRLVGRSRRAQCTLEVPDHDGIQRCIEPFDALDVVLGELERTDALLLDEPCEVGRRRERQLA
jgi:hypothetical protein